MSEKIFNWGALALIAVLGAALVFAAARLLDTDNATLMLRLKDVASPLIAATVLAVYGTTRKYWRASILVALVVANVALWSLLKKVDPGAVPFAAKPAAAEPASVPAKP